MATNENQNGGATLSEDVLIPAIKWMAEQVPGGFFVYLADDSQKLIYVNNVCLRLFGCETFEEFKAHTGLTLRGLVHPDDFERIQASIDAQIADPDNNNLDYVEYRIIRKDGSSAGWTTMATSPSCQAMARCTTCSSTTSPRSTRRWRRAAAARRCTRA